MDTGILIPNTSSIQVDWSIFTALLLLTFILHLWMMNIMLGTSIIALVRQLNQNKTTDLSHDIASHLPFTIAFTINFGIAPFLFLQVLYGHLIYSSSILMAVYWLSVIGILILAYYSAYIYDFKYTALAEKRIFFIGFTVIALLWIAFVFTNNMTFMLTPEKWQVYFKSQSGMWLNAKEPTLIPRYLHFVTASIALGGLAIAVYRKIQKDHCHSEQNDEKERQWSQDIQTGMTWFTAASLFQVGIGVFYLMSLPGPIRLVFLGAQPFGTAIFILAIHLVILMLICGFKKNVWWTLAFIIPVTILMVLMRHVVRTMYLAPYFKVQDLPVDAQYSPFIVFVVALILGVITIGYMIRLILTNKLMPEQTI